MKRKLSSTSLLFVLLLGLGSWYFLYEKKFRVESKKNEELSSKLIPYSVDEIQELEIIHPQGSAIALKKSGTQWLITAPVEDEADSSTINSLVASLSNAKEERLIDENPKQLEPFGLHKPQLTLKVSKDANTQEELNFGAQTQVGFGVYVRSASNPKIIKTSKSLLTAFQKSLFELRNKQLVTLGSNEIRELEFQGPMSRYLVNRSDEGKWFLQGTPVNETKWNKILSSLTQLKAKTVIAEKDKPLSYGLDRPSVKIWISEGPDKPKKSIWFSQAGGKVFAKRDDKPFIYEVDKLVLDSLGVSPLELRDDHLLSLNRFSVSKISITRPGSQVELVKEGTLWKLSDLKTDEKVDPGKVEGFLTLLQDMTGTKSNESNGPSTKPVVSIEVFESKNDQFSSLGKIDFEKVGKNSVIGKSTYLPHRWLIPLGSFKSLDKNKGDFLETPVTAKPEEKKS